MYPLQVNYFQQLFRVVIVCKVWILLDSVRQHIMDIYDWKL